MLLYLTFLLLVQGEGLHLLVTAFLAVLLAASGITVSMDVPVSMAVPLATAAAAAAATTAAAAAVQGHETWLQCRRCCPSWFTSTRTCASNHTRMHTHTHTHTHTHARTHICVCAHIHTHAHAHVPARIHMRCRVPPKAVRRWLLPIAAQAHVLLAA